MAKDLKNIFVLDGLRARILLIICCIVCYGNMVRNDYALDDDFAFYKNQYVQKGLKGIPDILTHPYYSDGTLSFDYRPVASIIFAVEKEVFGNNPHVSHGVNLLLYIICVLLVLGLLTEVFSMDLVPAFLITLIFAAHPVHTEVVASIKNREELLSFIFCLLGFFTVHRFFLQKSASGWIKYGLLTIVCLMLSFASKLTSIPMFGIIICMAYLKGWYRKPKQFYPLIGVIGILSLVYLLVIFKLSNRPIYDLENPLVSYSDISTKVGTTAMSLFFYFRFMWVPFPFSFFYGYNTIPVANIQDPAASLSILLHIALLILGIVLFYQKKLSGFFILSYFIAISVYSNILKPYTGIVSERAMFFPGLWFIAAVCYLIYSRVQKMNAAPKMIMTGVTALVLTAYGVLDINRVTQWHDTLTLMGHDVKHLENSTLANYFYGCVLKNKAEEQSDTAARRHYLDEAKRYLLHTIELSPAYPVAYYRIGLIYRYDENQQDSAYYCFTKAYELNQVITEIEYEYGRTQYEHGEIVKSANAFADLYNKIPNDTFTVFYHALMQMKTGHLDEGKKAADRFMQMAPNYYQSHFDMAVYYEFMKDYDNAAREYEASLKLGCTDQNVYRFMISYYTNHGRQQDANELSKLLQ